jgi:nucleotide-binding universal stress UspA family protein
MFAIRKVLVPTDFSNQARFAFNLACSLASAHQAEVVVLHVVPPPLTWGEVVARRGPDSYEEQLWEEYLLPLRPTEPGVRVSHRLEEGNPEVMIVRVAADLGCDLIVMGTHGRTGLPRLLMGSVAEHVLRCASCPVMTVSTTATTESASGSAEVQVSSARDAPRP